MVSLDDRGIDALRRVLYRMEYVFSLKFLRGINDFAEPWYDFDGMKKALEVMQPSYIGAFRLFLLGEDIPLAELENELGKEDAADILSTGLWHVEDGTVKYNNYVILYYQGILLVTEQNPWYKNCLNRNTDVYIGVDSYLLAEKIPFRRGAAVLDLCSGTGIQGMMAAKSASKVVSVEINPKAYPLTCFNVKLNKLDDVIEVRKGDLYSVLKEGEKFDCIYANPPFIPMLDTVEYPICGGGGEDGLMVLRKIWQGLPEYLRPNGEVVVFCECLGDEKGIFFNRETEALLKEQGWRGICATKTRMVTGLQLEKLADLTALFNENFDKEQFKKQLGAVYNKLGAKYLYSIVYNLKADEAGPLKLLDVCNPWHYEGGASVSADFHAERKGKTVKCFLGEKLLGLIGPDAYELIVMLRQGMTVGQAVKLLYVKYRLFGMPIKSYYAYLDQMLALCSRLETDGVLTRPAGDGK